MKENISFKPSSDGSMSAYNAEFDECYHSLKDGALSESLHKHIYPALKHLDFSLALDSADSTLKPSLESCPDSACLDCAKKAPIALNVLDICFGLGYNSFALLAELKNRGFAGRLKIYSPEKDSTVFERLLELAYPPFIAESLRDLEQILKFLHSAPSEEMSVYQGQCGGFGFELCVYKGDALMFLEHLSQNLAGQIDVVFQDAFSPGKNPPLWSEEYFKRLFALLDKRGIITTYSQSRAIRQNALNAGFKVYNYENLKTRGGSVMVPQGTPNLPNIREI